MSRLAQDVERPERDLAMLAACGIHLDRVAERLEEEGVDAFRRSYEQLLEALTAKLEELTLNYAGAVGYSDSAGMGGTSSAGSMRTVKRFIRQSR